MKNRMKNWLNNMKNTIMVPIIMTKCIHDIYQENRISKK